MVDVLDLFAKVTLSIVECTLHQFPDPILQKTIKGVVSAVPLEKVNEALDELRAYEIRGRRVVIPPSHQHHH